MTSIFWKRVVYPIIILATALSRVSAQNVPVRLTADEAIAAVLFNNHSLKIASLDEKAADARYKQTEAIYLPQASISYSAMSTNNPLNAFGFTLQQKSIGAADFDPARLNHPNATPDFMTSLTFSNPCSIWTWCINAKARTWKKKSIA